MSNVKKFEFKKSHEDLEIAGKEYRLEFNDAKLIEYNKSFDEFYQESKRLNQIDETKLTTNEQLDLFEDMKKMVKDILEILLGEGSFEELYEASDRSLINMMDVIMYLSEVVEEKMQNIRDKKKEKYLPKKSK